jgi:ATP-dependent DNA ligase
LRVRQKCAHPHHSKATIQRRSVSPPFPGLIELALASSVEKVPSGERWIHEVKFDGYRVQVHLVNGAVKVFTRQGNDWTRRCEKIAADAWHISATGWGIHRLSAAPRFFRASGA